MRTSHRCPKCPSTRLSVEEVRVEEWVPTASRNLRMRDGWYEQWACTRCGYSERYRLDVPVELRPPRIVDDRSEGEGPYR